MIRFFKFLQFVNDLPQTVKDFICGRNKVVIYKDGACWMIE